MADQTPRKIKFHFIKSNAFRVVYADGAIGGLAQRGMINMAFYNERRALPQVTEVEFGPDGATASDEKVIETREGVVREVEVNVIMTIAAAEELHSWLGERIGEIRAILEAKRNAGRKPD